MAWFTTTSAVLAAEPAGLSFDTANQLYEQGKYADAAAAYEKLLQSGKASAALYYNLGNAYFKTGQLGRAIAAYHQAREITPRDPDLIANLQFARNQVQGPTLLPSWWQRWLGHLTLNEWAVAAAAAVWVCFLLLAVQQWRPALRPALRSWTIALGSMTALLLAIAILAVQEQRTSQAAIIVARDTPVRLGPLNESPSVFTAQDGAELRITDRKDDWLQITGGPRRVGWVRRDQVVVAPGV